MARIVRTTLLGFLALAPAAFANEAEELVLEFRAAFAPTVDEAAPYRCIMPLVAKSRELWDELTVEQRSEITGLLQPQGLESTHVSPSGLFSLHFTTVGVDSVPTADTNPANGIPDFVERCAEYADYAWQQEVDTHGFEAPDLPVDGSYDVSFRKMGGSFYGYAYVDGATTAIVLHSTFTGGLWPGPTDDPDGDQLGRAKVTIAHEFKHATQFASSGWTEGINWPEIDAMWVEDIVFPIVDEYHYWVDNNSLSQLDAPWEVLNNTAGDGNYEDCLWQHYWSGTWGIASVVDLWERRALYPQETMIESYAAALSLWGSSWTQAYAGYMEWCWFTGTRAEPQLGFPDAEELWRMELYAPHVNAYPSSQNGQVPPLACHPRRYLAGTATGSPRVVFDATDDHDVALSLVLKRHDGSITIMRPPLGSSCSFDSVLADPWSSIYYLGILVTNGNPDAAPVNYTLDVYDDTVVGAPAAASPAPAARLDASPNPARDEVRFAIAAPGGLRTPLRVLDVRGREVARIVAPERVARFELLWSGRDARGARLPAGVYWAVAETGATTLVRKVVLVR